jgi:hypothetical protein
MEGKEAETRPDVDKDSKMNPSSGRNSFYPDFELSGLEIVDGLSSLKEVHCFLLGSRTEDFPLASIGFRKSETTFAIVLRCLDFSTQTYERIGALKNLKFGSQVCMGMFDGRSDETVITII